jgi:hypothetical protein
LQVRTSRTGLNSSVSIKMSITERTFIFFFGTVKNILYFEVRKYVQKT